MGKFKSALPYILDGIGVVSFITGSVFAYKRAEKTKKVVGEHESYRNDLYLSRKADEMSKKDYRKAMTKDTFKYGVDVAKSQWPTFLADGVGIGCIVASDILQHKKISTALTQLAAYSAAVGAADLNMALNNAGVETIEPEKTEDEGLTEDVEKSDNEVKYLEIVMDYNAPGWKATRGNELNMLQMLGNVESNFIEEFNRTGWYDLYSVCDMLGVNKKYADTLGENFLREHGAVRPEYDDDGNLINDSLDIVNLQATRRPNVSFFNVYYMDADGKKHLLDYQKPMDEYGETGYCQIFIPYESKPINGRRPEKK